MRKNIFANITFLLICIIFIITCVSTASADAISTGASQTLVFDGNTVTRPGASESSDLFVNSKGLMPGDQSAVQTVVIQNHSNEPITVYVYAEPSGGVDTSYADTNTFLSYFNMTIMHNTKELYTGSVVTHNTNSTWDRRNPIALGTISGGSQTTLDISLDADIKMPDVYQYHDGTVRWVFVINGETYYPPYTPSIPNIPSDTAAPPRLSPSVTAPSSPISPISPRVQDEVSPDAPEVIRDDVPDDINISPDEILLDNPPPVVIAPVVIEESPEAEIIIDDPENPLDAPKTGDEAKILMWSVLLIVFTAALICMIVIRVRNQT